MKTLDTRDLYERKQELESLRDALNESLEKQAEAEQKIAALKTSIPSLIANA